MIASGERTMKKNPGASGAKKKNELHPEVVELPLMLDPVLITQIADEQAQNFADSGSTGARLHNTKTVAYAIKDALRMVRDKFGVIEFRGAGSNQLYDDKREAGENIIEIVHDGKSYCLTP